MTVVLIVTFAIFAVKLVTGHQVVTAPTLAGADLSGAFVLEAKDFSSFGQAIIKKMIAEIADATSPVAPTRR